MGIGVVSSADDDENKAATPGLQQRVAQRRPVITACRV